MSDDGAPPGGDQPGSCGPEWRDDRGRFLPGNPAKWKPGRSGNPKGRPRRRNLTERLIDELEQPCEATDPHTGNRTRIIDPESGEFVTNYDALAKVIVARALAGQVEFLREIGDRLDPKQSRVDSFGNATELFGAEELRGEVLRKLEEFRAAKGSSPLPPTPPDRTPASVGDDPESGD